MEITAIEPYYDAGTATLNTSNRNMTGAGTQWLANVVPGDQVYGADGRMGGVVETVNSNTSITLTKNWRGANQSAGVYTIFRVSDSVRVENFSQRLLNLLLGGNVSALGGLTLGANKGIHATGAGALATHDLTAFARTLLDDADGAAARATLGVISRAATSPDVLGTFAPPNFSTTDLTPAEVASLVGRPGFFYFTRGGTGIQIGQPIQVPPGWPQTHGVVIGYTDYASSLSYTWQEFTGHTGNRKWMRRATSATTWSAWSEVYHRQNVVGSVSQSGGVPTGAIIERGSNANGEYIKFADGTQICTKRGSFNIGVGGIFGSLYISAPIVTGSWAIAFVSEPTSSVRVSMTSGALSCWAISTAPPTNTTATQFVIASSNSMPTNGFTYEAIAIGRWF